MDPRVVEIMKRVADMEDDAVRDTMQSTDKSATAILYHMLVQLCKGTALTIVLNSGSMDGAVVWRALSNRLGPRTETDCDDNATYVKFHFLTSGEPLRPSTTFEGFVTARCWH